MFETTAARSVEALPPVPRSPLPYRRRLRAARALDSGPELLRDAGGRVTRVVIAPMWLAPEMVFISSPKGAQDLLHHRDPESDRSSLPMFVELRRLLGGNLLNLPYGQWLPRRRAMQPIFGKQRIGLMTEPVIDAAVEVSRHWPAKGLVDLGEEIRRLTIRALSRSFLGVDLADEAESIGSSMHQVFNWIADRAVAPARLPMWLPTRAQRRARKADTELHRHASKMLHACRVDPTLEAPVIRALMEASDPETAMTLSDNDICDELVMFLFGGHDTISTTLTYALWQLGRHPDFQDRVAQEAAATGGHPLTAADLPRLGYAVQVIHEALRLCPPVPVLPRMVHKDIEVDGYRVRAGTFALVSVYVLHRDPELWSNPLAFDPDRWDPQRSEAVDRWQYLPFAAGPHSCMGNHFAMMEATLALATILRDVTITSVSDRFPTSMTLTMVPAGPVHAQARRRNAP